MTRSSKPGALLLGLAPSNGGCLVLAEVDDDRIAEGTACKLPSAFEWVSTGPLISPVSPA